MVQNALKEYMSKDVCKALGLITIVNKNTGNTRIIDKFARAKTFLLMFLISMVLFDGNAVAKENVTFLSEEVKGYCIEIGEEYGICPELLMAIAETENSGNPKAVNKECKGIMQISENWHRDRMKMLGVKDIFDVKGNILVAADYLLELFEKYEDVGAVLMFYNGNSNAGKYLEGSAELSKYSEKILERSRELELLHGK